MGGTAEGGRSRRPRAKCRCMKNIKALIADGGNTTLGAISRSTAPQLLRTITTHLAMLVQSGGKTLKALLSDSKRRS